MSVLYRRISNPGGFAGETRKKKKKKNARSCEERGCCGRKIGESVGVEGEWWLKETWR